MNIQSADGISGHLLYTGEGRYIFRVYGQGDQFVDYDLCHSDLHVTIVDKDAFFYQDGSRNVLDHSPETLGIKHD